MIRPVIVAAAWLLASAALAQTRTVVTQPQPVQNRANAAVTGVAAQLISGNAQSDSCTGVESAGYGSPMLGVSFNRQHTDRSCARIRKAKMLQQLGRDEAAVQIMCGDRDVREAMARANTPCELQRAP